MTKNLVIELSRAFETDCPPIHAVGIAPDEKVYVVAEIYESYYPAMPVGERNRGYIGTSICELVDYGTYRGLAEVFGSRHADNNDAVDDAHRHVVLSAGAECASNRAERDNGNGVYLWI